MGCDHSTARHMLYIDLAKRSLMYHPNPELRPHFTHEQKKLVTETWDVIRADITRVGVIAFLRLFEKYPDVQDLFVPFRGLSLEELKNSARLREHGLRVMGTVEKCITRLDRPDKLEAIVHELGQKHIAFNTKVEYIDLIVPQLLHAIKPTLGDKWTVDVEEAWSNFMKLVTHIMKEAMIM